MMPPREVVETSFVRLWAREIGFSFKFYSKAISQSEFEKCHKKRNSNYLVFLDAEDNKTI